MFTNLKSARIIAEGKGPDWVEQAFFRLLAHLEESAASPPITESPTKDSPSDAAQHFHRTAGGYTGAAIPPSSLSDRADTASGLAGQGSGCVHPFPRIGWLWTEIETPSGVQVWTGLETPTGVWCMDCRASAWFEWIAAPDAQPTTSTSQKPASTSSVPGPSPSDAPSQSGKVSECGVVSRERHLTCLMDRGHKGGHSSQHDGWGWCWNEDEPATQSDIWKERALAAIEADLARYPIQHGPLKTLADLLISRKADL